MPVVIAVITDNGKINAGAKDMKNLIAVVKGDPSEVAIYFAMSTSKNIPTTLLINLDLKVTCDTGEVNTRIVSAKFCKKDLFKPTIEFLRDAFHEKFEGLKIEELEAYVYETIRFLWDLSKQQTPK
jgi:hypothetical protein